MKRMTAILWTFLLIAGCGGDSRTTAPNPETGGESTDDQLAGEILYNGANVTLETSQRPTFWFRNETTGESIDSVTVSYDAASGRYGVRGLPETLVGISISIQAPGTAETAPGNYRSWSTVDLSDLEEVAAAAYDLDVWLIMRLLEPYDNSNPMTLATYPEHASPLTFTWESIEGATRYDAVVAEYDDAPYGFLETVVAETLTDTTLTLPLAASEPATHYEFYVNAFNAGGDRIGYYMTTYAGGYGWDYRFRIVD
jgi:hypothetical protein